MSQEQIEEMYGWICQQGDEAVAIAKLEDYALRDLLGWLARLNILTGIPGMIYGHCLVEASKRFQAQ